MKRWFIAVAGLSLMTNLALAQMDDVPPGHWAYQAIEELVQAGIIEGYPDGTFRPNRTLTRAEFAQAIARAYRNIDERIRTLNSRVEEIARQVGVRPGETPQPANVEELRRQVQELQQAVNELRQLRSAVETLQRLGQTFQQELASLGVDVDTLKKDFAALQSRVEALEKKRERITLSGDVTFGGYATHSIDGLNALTWNAVPINPTGEFLQSIDVLHELGLTLSGQINEQVSASATFILGNYLRYVRNAPAPQSDLVIWEAYVKTPIDLFGTTIDVTLGRFPAAFTPFTLYRPTYDFYLNFPRYNDHQYRVDGGALGFNFGTVRLNLWAAKTNGYTSVAGTAPAIRFGNHRGVVAGSDQFAGARVEFDALRGEETNLTIGATYFATGTGTVTLPALFFPANTTNRNIDRIDVFGGDIKAKWRNFTLSAEYAQSNALRDDDTVVDEENWALNASLSYDFSENLSISAGYLEVRPRFIAPGYWGRVGHFVNPSDLRGPYASISYKFSEDLSFRAQGMFLEGTGRLPAGAGGYQTADDLVHVVAGIDYKLTDRWNLSFSYEGAFWRPRSPAFGSPTTNPVWNYFTLGVGYDLGENTSLNVLYQIIDADSKGVAALGAPNPRENRGGVAAATLSIKF
ncbi:MAG: S-layer homology domain-containing protein [Armatimonadota bacterium]